MNRQSSFKDETKLGKLYLVPTPIGNLDDMTFRAVDVLQQVDLIAAEDTRHTQKLLNHFNIQTPQISFHEHNTQQRIPELVQKLLDGQSIAQVSDAGMPSISDPGRELTQAAIANHCAVVPLPGANAALTALVASGIAPQPFYFHGFLPRKSSVITAVLTELNQKTETLIFYESPYRVKNVLAVAEEVFGPEREVAVARELTKQYEEFIRGTIAEVSDFLADNSQLIRGEFVLVFSGNDAPERLEKSKEWENLSLKEHVEYIMKLEDIRDKWAIKKVASLRDLPKRDVYAAYHEI
ncbi:16S rRNA (cytidine(1402)-2'-O)-methyltransferase [Dolosigranulum pigrum]|uniref:16S rRNA (cytidine(1402)-2'-O)-methyltransferase n=1 Tax=Dolosigranulum pigrum TaxID=29394 RepID=UPI001AD85197|nr:16S rRNA (cytidine(1402)-2'-O)-methyltransferase [Dolosigranulum pigrum]QTJ35763.1 16S rRNA (cytidine(1402)-2'-O)-methyltransferase [Dolosigranulum pigrum]